MAFGQMTFGQMAFGQMTFGQMAFGQMTFGQMAFGQMAFGQMTSEFKISVQTFKRNANSSGGKIDFTLIFFFENCVLKKQKIGCGAFSRHV
jgi:hypothetical protein